MTKISTITLIKNSLKALVQPHKVFKDIPEGTRIDYKTALPFLFVFGQITSCFVYLPVTLGRNFGHYLRSDLEFFILIGFYGLFVWLIGVLACYLIGRFAKKQVSLYKIEIAAFYVVFFIEILAFFDLPYLFIPRNFFYLFGAMVHIYWLFAFIYIPLFVFFILRDVLGFSKKERFYSLLIALISPIVGRYIIEDGYLYLSLLLKAFNIELFSITCGFLLLSFLPIYVSVWLYLKNKGSFVKYFSKGVLLGVVYLMIAVPLIINFRILDKIPNGPVETRYFVHKSEVGLGKSLFTHSYTWTSSDYEPGTLNRTNASAATWWNDIYQDVVDTDFDPTKATINEIRVKVHFTSNTSTSGGGGKVQGCFAGNVNGGNGTFYCSNFWTIVSGASDQTFTINSSNIRTYEASDNGVAGSSSDWNTLTAAMAQNNNDVLVHSYTSVLCGYGCVSDVVEFDSVIVEIDYVTHLTQKTYRWYQNANSLDPTTPLAAENTAISNVKRLDIVRLRISIETQTGYMSTGTEDFKLQFSPKLGGSCSLASFWTDVGAIDTDTWSGYNNTPADGAQITTSLLDGGSNVLESYEEENNSVNNPAELNPTTPTGEWDWVLKNFNATSNTTYCFRMVDASGSVLATYNNYPEITTEISPEKNIKGKVNLKGSINLK